MTIPFETYKQTLANNILQSADYDTLENRIMEAQWEMMDGCPDEIKRALYQKLQSEIADENLRYLKERVEKFSTLAKGWDGEDAETPTPKATENVKNLLGACKSRDVAEWALFPNVNGTYLLQKQHALISIGDKEFTYWGVDDGKDIGEEYVHFSVSKALKAIRTINAYAYQYIYEICQD